MSAILIYHDVVEDGRRDAVGFPGPLAARYKHAPELFERHLEAIAQTGRRVGLVEPGSAPEAAITFDDGGSSALLAAEMLERFGWRGHFFITTSRIGTPGFLGGEEIRELAARGHAVGSHSHSHPTYMGRLTGAQLEQEWNESRAHLAEVLGTPPPTAAVPGGFLSPQVIEAAAGAGYRILMTSEPVRGARQLEGLAVYGRYTIWSSTPPATAAAYVRGSVAARARLWTEWQLKNAAKRASPGFYDALRRLRA